MMMKIYIHNHKMMKMIIIKKYKKMEHNNHKKK